MRRLTRLLAVLLLAAGTLQAQLVREVGPIGMTVSDLDRSIGFYTGVLQFRVVADTEVTGTPYEQLTGVFGVRLRVARLRLGGEEIELQDVPYDFENQTFSYVDPAITLMPGDVLTTECTFDNDGATKGFGDSSDDEMCFTDLFYYPAQGAGFICGIGGF